MEIIKKHIMGYFIWGTTDNHTKYPSFKKPNALFMEVLKLLDIGWEDVKKD